MGFNWGGKKWRPANVPKGQPKINQSIDELLKPLSEKKWKGNVWGSEIMNVEKETTPDVSPSPTPSITPSVTPSSPIPSVTPTPTVTPTPSATPPSPLSFQQTDTTTSPSLTSSSLCVTGRTYNTGIQKDATINGTAGSGLNTFGLSNFQTNQVHYQIKVIIPSGTTWNAGTWTVRLDAELDGFTDIKNIDICRVNSSGVSQATIGTLSMTEAGGAGRTVYTHSISGSSQSPSAGDYVVITYSFSYRAFSGSSNRIYPSQIINSPYI